MSTTKDFIEFVCEQIDEKWNTRYKKMFGEYMVYVNEKPILLVCDNIVYVKQKESILKLMKNESKGFPYKGAKEHFIVDVEDKKKLNDIIIVMEKETKVPEKKK